MKFATPVLALVSLYSTDAFMATTPKNVMQPLHATYVNGLSNPLKSTTGAGSFAPAPQAPSAPVTQAPVAYAPPVFQAPLPPISQAPLAYAPPAAQASPAAQAPPAPFLTKSNAPRSTNEIFEELDPVNVQGGSLRTCSFDETVNRFSVFLKTSGRPLNANVELWQGPENSPQKMSVYLEDGEIRPFRATVETPGSANAIAIRNTGQMEFPLTAGLECDMTGGTSPSEILLSNSNSRIVQGGAVYTTPFPPSIQSVQVALRSDGRPLNARIELLQGPNNNKQVMEIYTEDGEERPFYAVIDTPGSGNVVRIVNTATVEFPLSASVEPYIIDDSVVDQISANGGLTWS